MQKSIDLKQKQRDEQVQKLKEKLEKVKDHDLWTTIVSKTFEVRIQLCLIHLLVQNSFRLI